MGNEDPWTVDWQENIEISSTNLAYLMLFNKY
jgi:hypothetical protein